MAKKTTVRVLNENAFYALAFVEHITFSIEKLRDQTDNSIPPLAVVSVQNLISAIDGVILLLFADLSRTELRAVEMDLSRRHGITFVNGFTFQPIDPPEHRCPDPELLVVIPIETLSDIAAMLFVYVDHLLDLDDLIRERSPMNIRYEDLAPITLRIIGTQLEACFLTSDEIRSEYARYRTSVALKRIAEIPVL